MKKRTLGIDFGTCSIKLAEFELDKNSIAISRPAILKTPRFMVQNGRITDKNELADIIRQGLVQSKNLPSKVIALLNDSIVITRDIELPPGKPAELDKMVKLNASEYLPFDINEYTIRYRTVIPSDKNPRKLNYVLMASVKNDLVMDFQEVMMLAGLKLKAVDISINSMMKYFTKMSPDGSGTPTGQVCQALLEMGASTAKLVIFQDGFPVSQQIMNHSSQKIDVLIASSLNIERDQAETSKMKFGLIHLHGETEEFARSVGLIVNEQMDLFLSDVYRILQGFSAKNGGRGVQELWLTGGASMLPGLPEYIGDSFSIPCRLVEPDIAVRFEENDGKMLFPYFTNLAGAVIRGD